MSSDFSSNLNVSSYDEAWKEPVALDSERFQFHKIRIYGTLQLCKSPRPEYAGDLVAIESLRKEFYIGIRLNHPSVIRYYWFEDNNLYEEYVDGLTLRQLVDAKDTRLEDPSFVRSLVTQLFDALGYLHKNGVVHRDIKPENLIAAHVGDRLKIIDFGAAESDECDTTPGFTAVNLAPEQSDGTANTQTDIYQAGLVVKALTNGTRLSKTWRPFIAKATHPDGALRFRNVDEALAALPKERKSNKHFVFGLIAVCVSVVIAGYLVSTRFVSQKEEGPEIPVAEEATQPMEAETAPATAEIPVAVNSKETVAPQSEEDRLRDEINRFVTETYATNLKSICEETPPLDERGIIVESKMREFDSLFKKSLNQSFEFGKSLAAKNPGYKDFIEETLNRKVESLGSVYVSRFYEPNEIAIQNMGLDQ